MGKELSQAANVEGIFRRAIHPPPFHFKLCGEVIFRNTWAGSLPPSFLCKINVMVQDQVVNGLAKNGEKFCFLYVHRAQERVIATRGSKLIVDPKINGEVSHPVRFL